MRQVRPGGDNPAAHLDGLLARAQNGFDIDDALTARLRTALMHQSELRSCRHCNGRSDPVGCNTYRHVFLLPDGSSELLWELEHNTAPRGGATRAAPKGEPSPEDETRGEWRLGVESVGEERPRGAAIELGGGTGGEPHVSYELYADERALEVAERRVHERIGGVLWDELDNVPHWLPEQLRAQIGSFTPQRAYASDDSADHARRVLRRAENPDRPGEDVRELLTTAFAHDIALATKPRLRTGNTDATWCRFYEHAFLLVGGDEVVLWELEHNLTPDGRLVCEVYLNEAAAECAADRHARAWGVDL
ncbi:DUF6227 family protein [Streptomyces zagrosensis]|uniref:Uncharacterized protein n=1 Tax=Streptomyces zagrosensis TaxID=1042984 RepID=A0A7W9Q538_9ACTN|nr:DUF6227 family protein [Streptomyces zagrosensis]MBB5933773.1 hypothetical protein [Streptomyces zagrosensis]